MRFCIEIEAYLSLCYLIKWEDIGFLKDVIQEIIIIFQSPSAKKPKYAKQMLRQMHIPDTIAADLVLKNAYIANALVNL